MAVPAPPPGRRARRGIGRDNEIIFSTYNGTNAHVDEGVSPLSLLLERSLQRLTGGQTISLNAATLPVPTEIRRHQQIELLVTTNSANHSMCSSKWHKSRPHDNQVQQQGLQQTALSMTPMTAVPNCDPICHNEQEQKVSKLSAVATT